MKQALLNASACSSVPVEFEGYIDGSNSSLPWLCRLRSNVMGSDSHLMWRLVDSASVVCYLRSYFAFRPLTLTCPTCSVPMVEEDVAVLPASRFLTF